jgi:hypothetical protein
MDWLLVIVPAWVIAATIVAAWWALDRHYKARGDW